MLLRAGSNPREGTAYPVVMTPAAFQADARKMLALYPPKTDEEARASSYALRRDRTFAAPMRRWGIEQAKVASGHVPFQPRHPFVDGVDDVLNCFGTARVWTDADRKYADAMMGYWLAFARSGDPNAEGLPAWKVYNPNTEQLVLFGQGMKSDVLPNKLQLDFLTNRDQGTSNAAETAGLHCVGTGLYFAHAAYLVRTDELFDRLRARRCRRAVDIADCARRLLRRTPLR